MLRHVFLNGREGGRAFPTTGSIKWTAMFNLTVMLDHVGMAMVESKQKNLACFLDEVKATKSLRMPEQQV